MVGEHSDPEAREILRFARNDGVGGGSDGAGKLHALQGDGMEAGAAGGWGGGPGGGGVRLRDGGARVAGDGARADPETLRALRF